MASLGGADQPEWTWHAPYSRPFRLSGFAWFEQERIYRRLPRQPAETLPKAVDELANCTAGGQVAFRTDSPVVAVRVQLLAPADMVHMPATGQCGFDLYLGPPGAQRFVGITKYPVKESAYEITLFKAPGAASHELRAFTLNFPLYQGVKEVLVGLAPGTHIEPPAPWAHPKPIIVYGTSITQGGCAARPGMAYTNILSRKLNRPFVNLGFSGSGKGEPELARIMAQIADPAMLVLDYEANAMGTENYRKTLPEFIRILRARHAATPLLVLSRIPLTTLMLSEQGRREVDERMRFQRELVAQLREKGDAAIHFFDGLPLLGEDWDECTVDGSHPTDLGFLRMAEGLAPVFRDLLAGHRHAYGEVPAG